MPDHRCPIRLLELGLACTLVVVWPAVAVAAPPQVRLEATASLGLPPDDRAPFEAALADAARQGLEEAGAVEHADAPARLVIEVAWEDERRIDYVGHIQVRVADDSQAEPLAIRGFGCVMCGAEELLVRVRSEVALALGTVTWPAPEPVVVPAGAGPASPVDDARPARARVRLRALGATGVGVTGLGVVSVIVGAVLWSRDDRIELRPEDPEGPVWQRSYRPPGIGLVAAGVGAVLVGGTLVAVDLVRGHRRAVAMQPMLAPGLAGLRVGGRF